MNLFSQARSTARSTTMTLARKRCVLGCGSETPACPDCPEGQECSLIPMTCDACQMTICVPSGQRNDPAAVGDQSSGSGAKIGGAVGGAIGGVVLIAVLVYCVWRFCVKPKRAPLETDMWMDHQSARSSEKEGSSRRGARTSTHTVASVASSTMTRASNVIQIAYIPGVTNRGSAPSTPGLLVPPVPPLPMSLASSSPTSSMAYEQEHFFMPGDLRASTFSDRTHLGRDSVASTIYGKNAIVSPIPAQTAQRAKAAVVSVTKPDKLHDHPPPPPPLPNLDHDRFARYHMSGPPSPAFSIGETFFNNASASAASLTKPSVVKLSSLRERAYDDSDANSTATTIVPSPGSSQGPFADPRASPHLVSGTVSPASTRPPIPIPNLPELDTPVSQASARMPNLSELDTPVSRASARMPNLPELESHATPFGDEHEIRR